MTKKTTVDAAIAILRKEQQALNEKIDALEQELKQALLLIIARFAGESWECRK